MVIFFPGAVMKRRALKLAFLFAEFIFIQLLAAQARTGIAPLPELVPLPLSQQLATMREPLPVETIVDAALEFSGASDDAAAAAKVKLAGLLRKFSDEVANVNGQAELGERALTFLHKNLFTGYSVLQTRVDTALESGIYNCVSSAVLYMIMARSVGLSVAGVRTPDHAFCTVLVNGQPVDVETTNPLGFNPGAKKEFTDSFGKVTGYSYVPPGNYGNRRGIGEKELLSLILYNRVSEYGDGRLFRDALQPAVSAFTLMGNDEMRQVMNIAVTNYIAWLDMRQDFPQAVQFTDSVKAALGGSIDIEQPRRDMYHNWVVSLLSSNALADADALLSQPATRAALDDADWTLLSTQLVQMRAQAAANTGDFIAAAGIAAEGMKKLGWLQPLLQSYEVYIHNAATMLFNARKIADARTLIDQGLAVYPDSLMLQQDLDTIKKALKQ
jgi:hypothetical protein